MTHSIGNRDSTADVVLVRYGELALKSRGIRAHYENILKHELEAMLNLEDVRYYSVRRGDGRIYIYAPDVVKAAKAASRVFGVVSTSPAFRCSSELEDITEHVTQIAHNVIRKGNGFAIRVRRTGVHQFTSMDVGRVCGDAVLSTLTDVEGVHVDLTSPDVEIFVDVRGPYAFIYTQIVGGAGGLPYGTQGKVVSLFSGGIDSAVASWMMMKRGAEIVALYCDNAPFTDETTRNRAREGVKVLSRWSPSKPIRLYEVPTGDALSMISKKGDKFTCVLCKRMMYRLAAKVMEIEGCNGVVTGSSLGQVASQTLKNLMAEVKGLDIPLYHPLIGMDKQEVVELARKIETYEVSIKEATPCSAVPLKPSIDASPMHILELERELGMDTLIKSAIRDAVVLDVTPQSQF